MEVSITTVAKLVLIVMVIALVLGIITSTVNSQVGKLIGISEANTPEAPSTTPGGGGSVSTGGGSSGGNSGGGNSGGGNGDKCWFKEFCPDI